MPPTILVEWLNICRSDSGSKRSDRLPVALSVPNGRHSCCSASDVRRTDFWIDMYLPSPTLKYNLLTPWLTLLCSRLCVD